MKDANGQAVASYGRGQRTQPKPIFKFPSLQKPRSPNRLQSVVGLSGELSKPAKNEARCRWRRKLGAADSGERAGRGRCYPGRVPVGGHGDRVSYFFL